MMDRHFTPSTFLVLTITLANSALALDLEDCQAKEKKQAPMAEQLACYKALAEQQVAAFRPQKAAEPPPVKEQSVRGDDDSDDRTMIDGGLIAMWDPDQQNGLVSYKQNYLLPMANSTNPNNAPTSPNPNNRVPFTHALNNNEAKFQFSVKTRLYDWKNNPASSESTDAIWLAYTQQSFWQVYDASHSRPFRESNYEPEVIYSHRYFSDRGDGSCRNPDGALSLCLLNFGLVHQSNGQSNPKSRSWNRAYVQAGYETRWGEGRLMVLPRLWARIFQERNPAENDNPDITRYLGYGDLELRYIGGENEQYSIRARIHSLQVDLAYPILEVTHLFGWDHVMRRDLNAHFQYFTGYGESLLDYNQRHSSWGVGISLPY